MLSIFKKYPNLAVALSVKQDGSMKLSGDASRDKIIVENRKKFLNKLGINLDSLVSANLVHGSTVGTVNKKDAGNIIRNTDGLIAADKNLFLSITVADCLPIFLYDSGKEVVGLIHGGWRNLVQNILVSAIGKLSDDFASNPKEILVGIGPGLSQCHFEIKRDMLEKFKLFPPEVFIKKGEKIFFDLKKIAEIQLLNLGLKKENIEVNPECTHCLTDKYFSFRRDKPKIPETMMAIIGVRGF